MRDRLHIEIRPCTRKDCPSVLDLWRRADATPSVTDSLPELERTVDEPGAIFLLAVDRDGSIVGSVIGGWDGWRGNIYRLAVAPEARRNGLAGRLVSEVSRRLEAKGARRITALVEKAHPDAVAFWDSATAEGYRFDPRIVRYVRTFGAG